MEHIQLALQDYVPSQSTDKTTDRFASVALLLRQGSDGPEVLFIQRAQHPEDPWSGNLGFPGGRIDPEDSGPLATAIRETAEEVGITLTHDQLLAQLDDQQGVRVAVQVCCYVFNVDREVQIRRNYEVAQAFWVSLRQLQEQERHGQREIDWHGTLTEVPSIYLNETVPVLWGLTYRFVVTFFQAAGIPLSMLSIDDGLAKTN